MSYVTIKEPSGEKAALLRKSRGCKSVHGAETRCDNVALRLLHVWQQQTSRPAAGTLQSSKELILHEDLAGIDNLCCKKKNANMLSLIEEAASKNLATRSFGIGAGSSRSCIMQCMNTSRSKVCWLW